MAYVLIVTAHNRSTVFVRWRQCVRLFNMWFLEPTHMIWMTAELVQVLFEWPMPDLPIHYTTPPISPLPPKILLYYGWSIQAHLMHHSAAKSTHYPKQHLDCLSRFSTRSLPMNGQTDKQTEWQWNLTCKNRQLMLGRCAIQLNNIYPLNIMQLNNKYTGISRRHFGENLGKFEVFKTTNFNLNKEAYGDRPQTPMTVSFNHH